MIRQLSTTGTLDAATVQRLKEEIDQAAGEDRFQQSSDLGDGSIDWQSGFNDLQIEVEYLRSQNAALLNRLQEAGLVWDDGTELVNEDNDRIELLRLQLDDAIRNVHERDMRCQELTWEITKVICQDVATWLECVDHHQRLCVNNLIYGCGWSASYLG